MNESTYSVIVVIALISAIPLYFLWGAYGPCISLAVVVSLEHIIFPIVKDRRKNGKKREK